jgi:hypothetical protein
VRAVIAERAGLDVTEKLDRLAGADSRLDLSVFLEEPPVLLLREPQRPRAALVWRIQLGLQGGDIGRLGACSFDLGLAL